MKYSVIDIGSNSIRLTVYKVKNGMFRVLFKEKRMLGLAGYVRNGILDERGMSRAVEGLAEFRGILDSLGIKERIFVFATASFRNIINTDEAVSKVSGATGFDIDVISGEEEALLGYSGVMKEVFVKKGLFVDIGGASTETAVFEEKEIKILKSYGIGALKLYKENVKKILPGKDSVMKIRKAIEEEFDKQPLCDFVPQKRIICTGGTARAIMKLARFQGLVQEEGNILSVKTLYQIEKLMTDGKKRAADIILKVAPERIHTIIPGMLILCHIAEIFEAEKLIIANYGVREGYLCQKILK